MQNNAYIYQMNQRYFRSVMAMFSMATVMATMVMMAAVGAGAGLVDHPSHRNPRSGAGAPGTPLVCAGFEGGEYNTSASSSIVDSLSVNLSCTNCDSTTIPLVATWLGGGITAGDLICTVGVASPTPLPPPLLPPRTHGWLVGWFIRLVP